MGLTRDLDRRDGRNVEICRSITRDIHGKPQKTGELHRVGEATEEGEGFLQGKGKESSIRRHYKEAKESSSLFQDQADLDQLSLSS